MTRSRFTGKVVLLTGAANGMGISHARNFAAEGALLMLGDIDKVNGEALSEELGDAALFQYLDVASEASWQAAFDRALEVWGQVDVLVNNAGIGPFKSVLRQTPEEFRRILDVNVMGTFLGMRTVLPHMVTRGSGAIVNIGSTSGIVGAPGGVAYGASKWAVRGMSKVAAIDLIDTGVRVNIVNPATTRTAMTVDIPTEVYDLQPIPRLGEPQEISNVVLFAASDEASFCTGSDFTVDGGATVGRTFHFLEDPKDVAREIKGESRKDELSDRPSQLT